MIWFSIQILNFESWISHFEYRILNLECASRSSVITTYHSTMRKELSLIFKTPKRTEFYFKKKGCTVMYNLLFNIIQFQNIKQYQWKHLNHDIFHTHYFWRRVPFATIAVEGDNLFIFSYFFTYEHCNCIFEILNWGVKKSKYHFFCPYYIQTTWHTNNFQIPIRKKNLP